MQHTRTTAAVLTAAGLALASLATVSLGMTSAAATPATGAATTTATTSATARPGAYVATTPTRALDTRVTGGALGQASTRRVDLSGIVTSRTATAAVLNLTVADPTADGYLTVFPTGSPQPVASSINKRAGEIRSNSVTVALPPNGSRQVNVFNQSGSTQVIVDVVGWYDPAAVGTGSTYSVPDAGGRPFDSRPTVFAPGTTPQINMENDYIAGHRVEAVAVNLTAVGPLGPGYLTAWTGAGPQPAASTVNYGDDAATPNFAIVPVIQQADGSISFRVGVNVSPVSLVVDVIGYYTHDDTAGGLYVATPPTRVTDTRDGSGAFSPNDDRCESVATQVPATALAVNLDTTAVDATNSTFITVYGCGQSKPTTSTLNPQPDGYARANAAQPLLGTNPTGARSFAVYNQQGSVNVVADLQGWFVPQG